MSRGLRLISLLLVLCLSFGAVVIIPAAASETVDTNGLIKKENKELRLWYDAPAPDDPTREWQHTTSKFSSWETKALALGNAYLGAKVFGLTDRERIQINENTLSTSGGTQTSGTTNFTETYLHFDHELSSVTGYERDLVLNNAISHVKYTFDGVEYSREYFASYPDKVLVIRLDANKSGSVSFTLEPKMPYYAFEGKTGDITVSDISASNGSSVGTITLEGNLPGSNKSSTEGGYVAGTGTVGYDMDFEAQFRVFANGGKMTSGYSSEGTVDEFDEYSNGTITVEGADSAYIIIALGTNYELDPQIFLENNNGKKLDGFAHPHEKVTAKIEAASLKSYEELRAAHIADYTELFDRVSLNLTSEVPEITTDALLEEYRAGNCHPYVEELLFAFGRYSLISSSRSGNLPPNLNGIWNRYHGAICLNGYWANVNIQMNYWSAFNTDLGECFDSFVEFYDAFIEGNTKSALARLVKEGVISSTDEIDGDLWSMATGTTPFSAPSQSGGRDGWGNTPFMAEVFWDYYDYTRDEEVLKDISLPALMSSARFLSYIMKYNEEQGIYLTPNSGSPEQSTTTPYIDYVDKHPGYIPEGTTYDQALAYSNYLHVLAGVEVIGEENLTDAEKAAVARIREQIDKLDPIPVGLSGQVKEFREENYYGEIGEPNHRHINHLTTLYPGSVITERTSPAWVDAAKVSLDNRGDGISAGWWAWSYGSHVPARARTGDGNKAYEMLNLEIVRKLADNYWLLGDGRFQVESTLAAPAGIAEMLLQSHDGYIAPLAALPDAWSSGSYSGLVARGNFSVGAAWENGLAQVFEITSRSGERASVYYPGIANAKVTTSDGRSVSFTKDSRDVISFNTTEGVTYVISGFEKQEFPEAPETLGYSMSELGNYKFACSSVEGAVRYNLYTAVENSPVYTLIDSSVDGKFTYKAAEDEKNLRTTFAVTAVNIDGRESERTLAYHNPEDLSAEVVDVSGNLMDTGEMQIVIKAKGSVSSYKLYTSSSAGGALTLVEESAYPIIIIDKYDRTKQYYVSTVNAYDGSECEPFKLVRFGSGSTVVYNPENIFEGKSFTAGSLASSTHSGLESGVMTYYNYGKLTDGSMHHKQGRYSTVSTDATQTFDGTLDLGSGYILGEITIYDFSPSATAANSMGSGLTIEAFSLGKWTEVFSAESNAEILAHRVGSSYLSFDLSGVRAEKIRIYIPSQVKGYSISIYEIKCTGVKDDSEYTFQNNLFSGKQFALNGQHNLVSGTNVANLTDGSASTMFRANAAAGASINASLDLGTTALINSITVNYDFNSAAENNAGRYRCGNDISIYVTKNGKEVLAYKEIFKTADLDKDSNGKKDSTTFNLGGIEAESVRIYISGPYVGNNGVKADYTDYTSIKEISCSGYEIGEACVAVGERINILSGREFTPGDLATGTHDGSAYGYSKLTDGGFDYKTQRYSTISSNSVQCFDGSVLFGAPYSLNELQLYDYLGNAEPNKSDPTYAGIDLLVEVLVDGAWVAALECKQADYASHRVFVSNTAGGAYLSFDLGGVVAEGIRIFSSNRYGTSSISYYEIKLFGSEHQYSQNTSSRENAFETVDITTDGTVSASNPLSNINDGKSVNYTVIEGTDGSYSLTVTPNIVKPLKHLKIYERILPENLIDGLPATASDKTTVEVMIGGVWHTIYKDVSLGTGLYTEFNMFGIYCEKVRITFKNTRLFDNESQYRCAAIGEITCTSISNPVDRSALLNAFKAYESVDVSQEFGFDEMKAVKLNEFITFLSDIDADTDKVASYISVISTATDRLAQGAVVTDKYGDLEGYNLTLGGAIGFNFYAELTDDVGTAFPNAYFYVEYSDGTVERISVSDLPVDSEGRVLLKFVMPAATMTDNVKVRLVLDGENCGRFIEHSVRDYGNAILADSKYETTHPGITNMIKAMLNYGAYAQKYFEYNTDSLANEGLDGTLEDVTDDSKMTKEGDASGLRITSWMLLLDSEVKARLYFKLDEGLSPDDYTARAYLPDGSAVILNINTSGSRYFVTVDDIPSYYLDNIYRVEITNNIDGTTVSVNLSAMCYVSETLKNENAPEALVDLVKSLKIYSNAANTYTGR